MEVSYQQCDETPLIVHQDQRRAGAKSYMWVHTTSELAETDPIILFCFELTRGTDYLRNFYKPELFTRLRKKIENPLIYPELFMME